MGHSSLCAPLATAFAIVLLALLTGVLGQCNTSTLTGKAAIRISTLIRDRIFCYNNVTDENGNRFHPLLAGFVRLAFHSSIDNRYRGCINLNDLRNARLRPAVDTLESILFTILNDQYYTPISRADLWAFAGIVAVELASGGKIYIDFRYGRCDDCKKSYDTDAIIDFPVQTKGGSYVLDYFRRKFNFTMNEAIAIMGAHSLGLVSNTGTSKIFGNWMPDADRLTNNYFGDMLDASNRWTQIARNYTVFNETAWQWTRGVDNKRAFLNVDMGLTKTLDIPDDSTGKSTCSYFTCPTNATMYNVVLFLANSYEIFAYRFQAAFTKMVEYGHVGLVLP